MNAATRDEQQDHRQRPREEDAEVAAGAVSARRAWVSISGPRITPRITGAIGKS